MEDPARRELQIAVLGLQLSLFFLILLLIIVNMDGHDSPSIFLTRRSYFVYETLLAGVLGAYLSEISRRASTELPRDMPGRNGRFATVLLLGGAAGIIVGVLFPLVVLGQFEGPNINSWTLVVAGGIAGNQARSALSQVEEVIARMLDGFRPNMDTAAIVDSVKVGVKQAFAGPELVKYEGFISMDVVENRESLVRSDGQMKFAFLPHEALLEVRVQFAPKEADFDYPSSGVIKHIDIAKGSESALVPFRLLVDFGFAELAPVEREVAISRYSKSQVETFPFTIPVPARRSEATTEEQFPSQISVSVYQHSRYFDSCIIATSAG